MKKVKGAHSAFAYKRIGKERGLQRNFERAIKLGLKASLRYFKSDPQTGASLWVKRKGKKVAGVGGGAILGFPYPPALATDTRDRQIWIRLPIRLRVHTAVQPRKSNQIAFKSIFWVWPGAAFRDSPKGLPFYGGLASACGAITVKNVVITQGPSFILNMATSCEEWKEKTPPLKEGRKISECAY